MSTQEMTQIRNAWNAIAAGYDEFVTPTHIRLANEGLERLGPISGLRFLDVAAGSGALSIPAARRGAEVVSVDLSATMIEQLNARAAAEGLNMEGRVMDGHALELALAGAQVARLDQAHPEVLEVGALGQPTLGAVLDLEQLLGQHLADDVGLGITLG